MEPEQCPECGSYVRSWRRGNGLCGDAWHSPAPATNEQTPALHGEDERVWIAVEFYARAWRDADELIEDLRADGYRVCRPASQLAAKERELAEARRKEQSATDLYLQTGRELDRVRGELVEVEKRALDQVREIITPEEVPLASLAARLRSALDAKDGDAEHG